MKFWEWLKSLFAIKPQLDPPPIENVLPIKLKMPVSSLAPHTLEEYETKFDVCVVNSDKLPGVRALCAKMVAHKDVYVKVETSTGVPWYVVACIHSLEGGLNFGTHLHNGDPLTGRTYHVPAGRPKKGVPPFAWYESAIDALGGEGAHKHEIWSLGYSLNYLETYNGLGYRKRGIPSPYLWSFTDQYKEGKYVADGKFDAKAVSKQTGAAAILKALELDKLIVV